MRPRMFVVRYSHVFEHDAASCFAWLTDYQDDDPSRAGAILLERRVQERHPERTVMEVDNVILGRHQRGRAEVRLFRDELRYEARSLEGDGGAILYTYKLTRLGADQTRLDVSYGTRVRRRARWLAFTLARPLIRARVRQMWKGFERAMDRELGPGRGSTDVALVAQRNEEDDRAIGR